MKYIDFKIGGITILSSIALLNAVTVTAQENPSEIDTPLVESSTEIIGGLDTSESAVVSNIDNTNTEGEILESATGIEDVIDTLNNEATDENLDANSLSPTTGESIETTLMENTELELMGKESTTMNDAKPVEEINPVTSEHQWYGTYFGESTNDKKNSVTVNADGTVTLKSANYDEETKIIQDKGGKFTAFHDGISYYYTEIDAKTENFSFTATFNVDYLNPKADGQEGFGIIARDQIGFENVGDQQFPSNSAAALALKVKVTDENGDRKDLKPGLASRFVTGLTEEIIQEGATSMSTNGSNVIAPFKDDMSMKVVEGEKYTLTLKKTNTGYHAVYTLNGETFENILYGTDKLLQINQDKIYLGIAAARGVVTTVSDMVLEITNPETDAPAESEPIALIEPTFKLNNYDKTGNENYNLELVSNVAGRATIYDAAENVIAELDLDSNYPKFVEVKLANGENQYTAKFSATNPEQLTIKDTIVSTTNVKHKTYQGYYKENVGTYLNVSPTGTVDGDGTPENPLDIFTAIDFIQPGQMIELVGGVYDMNQNLIIQRNNNGTETLNKLMGTVSSEPAIFDFTNGGSFILNGDYWQLDNIHIRNTQGNIKGLTIGGNHNHIQRIVAYNNGDTGIQISGNAAEHSDLWPSYNVVENSTSYNNVDPGHNNADGFAAKITVGEGNIFRGDIAYNNVDDGWDLFAKLESGLIGVVTIEDSIAFQNGTNLEKDAFGDGNGFKLGGDGISIGHILKNSLSFNNDAAGVTSNSNPASNVYNVISVKNKGTNLSLYGKGNAEVISDVEGIITWDSGVNDVYGNETIKNNIMNYINGQNIDGLVVDETWFENTDMSMLPIRNEDGSIDLRGLFVLVNQTGEDQVVKPIVSNQLVPYFRLVDDSTDDDPTEEIPQAEEEQTDGGSGTEIGEEIDKVEEKEELSENSDWSNVKSDSIEIKKAQLPATGESKQPLIFASLLAFFGAILAFYKKK